MHREQLTGVAVQFPTQDQKNATPVKKCKQFLPLNVVLFIPISSKLEFFAMQNFESKLFPVCAKKYLAVCAILREKSRFAWKKN